MNMIVLVLLGAGLLAMSWHKWMNMALDYGRELYIPWRITCGQVLYKDIASLFGPFPPYCNALLFKIFGASIMTLVFFNILVVLGITVMIYRFFNYTMDQRTALFTSCAFLVLFAFQQSNLGWDQGNFSYICPYSYSVTYAVFFSFLGLDRFLEHDRSGKDVWLAMVGGAIGLTALCRFEIFVCMCLAIILGLVIKRKPLKAWILVLAGFSVPIGIAYLYFLTQLPFAQVGGSIFGFNEHWWEIFNQRYYLLTAGLDNPWANFKIMLATAACYGLVVIIFKFLCLGDELLEKKRKQVLGTILVIGGMVGIVWVGSLILCLPYNRIFKGMAAIEIFMVGYLTFLLVRHQRDEPMFGRLFPLWVMAVWGFLMLAKVFLNAQTHSEGFVYALPGTLLLVALFQGFVPQYFERVHQKGHLVKTLATILLILIFMKGLSSTLLVYQARNLYIRSGGEIMACGKGFKYRPSNEDIAIFINNVDKIMTRNSTFVAFPQGAMLNFLTKRINPLPYTNFSTAETVKFGEPEMLRSLKQNRPDYIILAEPVLPLNASHVHVIYPYLIRAWILTNYKIVWCANPRNVDSLTVLKRIL